jgi:hypothetical protein
MEVSTVHSGTVTSDCQIGGMVGWRGVKLVWGESRAGLEISLRSGCVGERGMRYVEGEREGKGR